MLSKKESKAPIFLRDATGLVREVSIIDSFFGNLGFISIGLGLITYILAPILFPGGDPILATIITGVFCILGSVMFTLFTWAMPRSGGDYMFVGRTIHPIIGFMSNFSLTFWVAFLQGIVITWMDTSAISPALATIGAVSGNQALTNLSTTVAEPVNTLVISLTVLVIITLVMISGVKKTFRVSNVLVLITIVGIGIMLWLLASSTNSQFATSFSRFASYQGIVTAGHAAGFSPEGPYVYGTLGLMPFVFLCAGYGIVTSYFAGEVKSVKKNALYSQVLSAIIATGLLAVLGALAIRVFGYDFLGSISQLQFSGSSQYPFSIPPSYALFVSLLTTDPTTLWAIAVTLTIMYAGGLLAGFMIMTRSIFAWSFDRVIPSKLATVSERFHTPVYAIVIMAIAQAVGIVSYIYASASFSSLVAGSGLAELIPFMLVAIAAVLFPYRRKDLYKSSPANISVGPIPLISIVGVVNFVFYGVLAYFYMSNPLYGANTPVMYESILLTFIIPVVIFAVAYYFRKREGIDLMLAFKQLPPE
jgi:amino acid transporter